MHFAEQKGKKSTVVIITHTKLNMFHSRRKSIPAELLLKPFLMHTKFRYGNSDKEINPQTNIDLWKFLKKIQPNEAQQIQVDEYRNTFIGYKQLNLKCCSLHCLTVPIECGKQLIYQ